MSTFNELALFCPNDRCPEHGLVKIAMLTEIALEMVSVPKVICARCGYHAQRVDLSVAP